MHGGGEKISIKSGSRNVEGTVEDMCARWKVQKRSMTFDGCNEKRNLHVNLTGHCGNKNCVAKGITLKKEELARKGLNTQTNKNMKRKFFQWKLSLKV